MSGYGDASTSLAETSERLFNEFGADIGLAEIMAVVRQCRRELDIAPKASVPELVERLARTRLPIAAEAVAAARPAESAATR